MTDNHPPSTITRQPRSLPLPKSGRIRYICHIADIHIRPGTESKESRFSRFDEFLEAFEKIALFLETNDSTKDTGDLAIVIAGDIVHDNRKAGAPCIELFYEIMKRLSDIAPIYIIRGNHDYNQSSIVPQDILGSLMYGLSTYKNIAYLSETGLYRASNAVFGVLAIQDALKAGDTHGRVDILPTFPYPEQEGQEYRDDSGTTNIALFHGDVPHTYPIEWISKGYDYVLMGDLHGQQIQNMDEECVEKDNDLNVIHTGAYSRPRSVKSYQTIQTQQSNPKPWAYSGSVLQQNFGEALLGHGFLLWDIDRGCVNAYHVKNRFGFVTVMMQEAKISKGSDDDIGELTILIDVSRSVNQCIRHEWIPIDQAVALPWFPETIRLRIKKHKSYEYSFTQRILDAFKSFGIGIESSQETFLTTSDENSTSGMSSNNENFDENSGNDLDDLDLQKYNNAEAWCTFIKESTDIDEDGWRSWFHKPESLIIDLPEREHIIPSNLRSDVFERNKKIHGSVDLYRRTIESLGVHSDTIGYTRFSLLYMNWSYILCFHERCHFNFETLDNNVHCIGGKNGFGKTSFLETICIALFGEGFPNRTNKQFSSSIICMQTPPKKRAYTSIVFRVDHERYRLKRTFEKTSADTQKLQSKDISLERYIIEEDKFREFHSGKKAVQEWMSSSVGSLESFLTSCMISQTSEEEFFSKKVVEQKSYLDKQLKLDSSTAFLTFLKTASLAHIDIIKRVRDVIDILKDSDIMHIDVTLHESNAHDISKLTSEIERLQFRHSYLRGMIDRGGADENLMKLGYDILMERKRTNSEIEGFSESSDDTRTEEAIDNCRKDLYLCQNRLDTNEGGIRDTIDAVRNIHTDLLKRDLDEHILKEPTKKTDVDYMLEQREEEALLREIQTIDIDSLETSIKETLQMVGNTIKCIDEMKKEQDDITEYLSTLKTIQQDIQDHTCQGHITLQEHHTPQNQHIVDPISWNEIKENYKAKYTSIDNLNAIRDKHRTFKPLYPKPLFSLREIEEKEMRLSKWNAKKMKTEESGTREDLSLKMSELSIKLSASMIGLDETDENIQSLQSDVSHTQDSLEQMLTDGSKPPPPTHSNEEERDRELQIYYEKNELLKSDSNTRFKIINPSSSSFTEINSEKIVDIRQSIRYGMEFEKAWITLEDSEKHYRELLSTCDDHTYNTECTSCMTHPWKMRRDVIKHDLECVREKKESILKEYENRLKNVKDVHDEKVTVYNEEMVMITDKNRVMIESLQDQLRVLESENEKYIEYEYLKQETQSLRAFWKMESKILQDNSDWEIKYNAMKASLSEKKMLLKERMKRRFELSQSHVDLEKEIHTLSTVAKDWDFLEQEWKDGLSEIAEDMIINTSTAFKGWDRWETTCTRYDEDLTEWVYIEIEIAKRRIESLNDSISTDMRSLTNMRSIDLPLKQKTHCDHLQLKDKMDRVKAALRKSREYNSWSEKFDELQNRIDARDLLMRIESKTRELETMERICAALKSNRELSLAIKFIDVWNELEMVDGEIGRNRLSLFRLEASQPILMTEFERYEKNKDDLEALYKFHTFLTERHNTLMTIMNCFSNFKDWVLEHKIIPIILGHINTLLDLMCLNHRPIALRCLFEKVKKDEVQKSFTWVLSDGHHQPPLEKASGFQKCVVNLAMRIILGRLGVSGIRNTQLFIDEGFTSCDGENLQNIPYVLKKMLSMYSSVLLVSHLDELKNHIPSCIDIVRDENLGLSSLKYGEKSDRYNFEKREKVIKSTPRVPS